MGMLEARPAQTPLLHKLYNDVTHRAGRILDGDGNPVVNAVGNQRYMVDSARPELANVVAMLARSTQRSTIGALVSVTENSATPTTHCTMASRTSEERYDCVRRGTRTLLSVVWRIDSQCA